jgi:hypothetical protein
LNGFLISQDGRTHVDIDAGFEVAPGDASDVEVANAHTWSSAFLVFADGRHAATSLIITHTPDAIGTAQSCSSQLSTHTEKSGKKMGASYLYRDGARVSSRSDYEDVLLRKRA